MIVCTINFIFILKFVNAYSNSGVVPKRHLSVIFTNYPFSKIACDKPGKMKLGGDAGHDRKFASPPSSLFLLFIVEFLTNQNVRNKTLSSNCEWRRPELLPATETFFKFPKMSIIVSTC